MQSVRAQVSQEWSGGKGAPGGGRFSALQRRVNCTADAERTFVTHYYAPWFRLGAPFGGG